MKKNNILLSTGSIPWFGLKESIRYAKNVGFDGIEIIPSRKITNEANKIIEKYGNNWIGSIQDSNSIKSIHQNWRLDIGLDKSYGIQFTTATLFTILRLKLFPKVENSNETIKLLSTKLNLPVIVHDLSGKWTKDNNNKEFAGGILYEIIGTSIDPKKLQNWIEQKNHNIALDSRDDQSLVWAKKYGFNTWQTFWKWLEIKKIKSYQLTLIGMTNLRKIMKHKKSLAEEQLLWLNKNMWEGHVTVEVNPLILFFLFKGNMEKGLRVINQFVRQTLLLGKKWSD